MDTTSGIATAIWYDCGLSHLSAYVELSYRCTKTDTWTQFKSKTEKVLQSLQGNSLVLRNVLFSDQYRYDKGLYCDKVL